MFTMTTVLQVGSIGRGRLAYTDGLTWLMKFDDLAYFSRFGSHRQVPLPIVFHEQAPADVGKFHAVVIIPFEPLAPPVFRRDLLWDPDPLSSGTAGWMLPRSGRILPQLTVALMIVTFAH